MSMIKDAMNLLRYSVHNSTLSDNSSQYSFYYLDQPALLSSMSDKTLSVVTPVIVFWAVCVPFDFLDNYAPAFLGKYRIHDSPEVASKNRVTKLQVVLQVMFQQVMQTALGLYWLEDVEVFGTDHPQKIFGLHNFIAKFLMVTLGANNSVRLLNFLGPQFVPWLYWWGIPLLQFSWAFFIIDTWQYTLHRTLHTFPFLYKHLHSWHHRLYAPYAYSSLYNHPIEGLLLDIIGALLSYDFARMTPRQGIILFGVTTAKTAHDHCGWSLPWDPMQFMFKNNAAYHDIHHQTIGIKHNFSQPFFAHWDKILGTGMTREQMEQKRKDARAKTA